MAWWQWALVALAVYAAFVVALLVAGRRSQARALAGFVPDCLVLFRRLLGDPRVRGWRKVVVVVLLAYLAMPFDLVPDFIPVAGALDDLLAVVLALRIVLGGAGEDAVREHWPGPEESLALVLRAI